LRIKSVIFKNYRQFADVHIDFYRKGNDLHIFVGKNGAGKTNFLNGINWCLYGDEPHLARDSQALPLLNVKALELGSDDESTQEVLVNVVVETGPDREIMFLRKARFKTNKRNNQPSCILEDSQFEVRLIDQKGNTKIVTDEEAQRYVERLVPKRIREFFFFDGERLDSYFKASAGPIIKSSVFEISRINTLDQVERKLDAVLKEIRREATKLNPMADDLRKKLEEAENYLENINNQIEEYNNQIIMAKEKLEEIEEELRKVPGTDIDIVLRELKNLRGELETKRQFCEQKIKEKQDILVQVGPVIMLWPAIRKTLQIIAEKRENREIPPNIPKDLLESVLRNNSCDVCGRTLDDSARIRIEDMLREIKLTSEVYQRLIYIEGILKSYHLEKAKRFIKDLRKLTEEIGAFEKDLQRIQTDIQKREESLSNFNIEKIRELQAERKELTEVLGINQKRQGELGAYKKALESKIEGLKNQLTKELKKAASIRKTQKELLFCEKALEVLRCAKERIIEKTMRTIGEETDTVFKNLIWKTSSFKNVKIDKDFNLSLIHETGYDCLGSVSAGERELLALSFTLALHKVSGFESSILIDTPVARMSDEHRENFADIFAKLSKDKQVILLFTPSEYTTEISKVMNHIASTRHRIIVSEDEKEAQIERLC